MYIVYILQSAKDKRTYVGYTDNFKKRFNQHNSGQVKSTKFRAPLKLLLKEEFESLTDAKKRELWWKSGAGRRKLRELLVDNT